MLNAVLDIQDWVSALLDCRGSMENPAELKLEFLYYKLVFLFINYPFCFKRYLLG